jgi:hypothetical protein
MSHVIEQAANARAKCRGCGQKIGAGELRFGERLPNPYAEEGGEMTHWFHLACASFRRPEPFLAALETSPQTIPNREDLAHEARLGVAHHRLPRVSTAERAPTGRATCRSCRSLIDKGTWRLALVYYEDGRFVPSGFIHARCVRPYLETTDVLPRVAHFSPALGEGDLEAIRVEAESADPAPSPDSPEQPA